MQKINTQIKMDDMNYKKKEYKKPTRDKTKDTPGWGDMEDMEEGGF